MDYRIAKTEDLDEICDLVLVAIAHMEEMCVYQWDDLYPTREVFAEDIRLGQLTVGTVGGVIAVIYVVNCDCDEAYALAAWEHPNDRYCVIHRLCVHPLFQHRGLARQTVEYAQRQCRDQGFQSVRLDVYQGNPWARKLYDELGYKSAGYADWRKGRFFLLEKHL